MGKANNRMALRERKRESCYTDSFLFMNVFLMCIVFEVAAVIYSRVKYCEKIEIGNGYI